MIVPKLYFIRNIVLENLLEIFLVSAVAAILAIRFYLHFTGYPQIGDAALHVAHTLVGGMIMLLSVMIFIHYMGKSAVILATILAGLGFGTFIDELGKFITRDNNYFFEPVIAFIYVIFMIIYLSFKILSTRRDISTTEYLANTVEIIKQAIISGLDKQQLELAQYYLKKVRGQSQIKQGLVTLLAEFEVAPEVQNQFLRFNHKIRSLYRQIIVTDLFKAGVVLFFILQTFFALSYSVITTQILPNYLLFHTLPQGSNQTLAQTGQLIFASTSTLFVIAGIFSLIKSRATAFNLFKVSVLVNIFFTQVFMFYEVRFEALLGLIFDLTLLYILNHLIYQETALQEESVLK